MNELEKSRLASELRHRLQINGLTDDEVIEASKNTLAFSFSVFALRLQDLQAEVIKEFRKTLRLFCWWQGHKLRNNYGDDMPWCCERCEFEIGYHEAMTHEGMRWKLRKAWRRFREWWQCSECGGRFGRHDLDTEHFPF